MGKGGTHADILTDICHSVLERQRKLLSWTVLYYDAVLYHDAEDMQLGI
jgi:hypothetical protein